MRKKPIAAGPPSRTVIGADVAPTKTDWKKLVLPIGMIGLAVYITMKYKGHV